MKWNADIARYWRNYVPPCRPSRSDLHTCSEILARIRGSSLRRPKVLILGSTTEFRDWAFEERVEAVVVDSSLDYHTAVSAELTHHNPYETLEVVDWRAMDVGDDFDLVVGDLAIGQIPHADLDLFLARIRQALADGRYFLTKSFFDPEDGPRPTLSDVLKTLREPEVKYSDPFPIVAHELTLACMDPLSGTLRFADMFEVLEQYWQAGEISDCHMDRFREFGWDSVMKVEFSIPTLKRWRQAFSDSFREVPGWEVEEEDIASVPLFVLQRTDLSV